MKIELLDLTVRDFVAGYRDDGEGGVVGCGGVHCSMSNLTN
ncbi:MAG: hypothetical protein OXG09_02975 [Chloroflexi bacterium]|nr:hypothetical protein [Chloroflexota bacterium]